MRSRLLLASTLLLAAACKKKEEAATPPAGTAEALPGRSSARPSADEEEPDPRIALRASFDRAKGEADTAVREKILESVAWDAIDVDPALSREAFSALAPDSASSRRLVGHFAMRLADEDPQKAVAWASELEQPEERSDAFGRIAVVISAKDPAAAATLVAEQMTAGPSRDRAVVQVLQRWVQSSPADAAGWITGFPQGAARSAGLKEVAVAWVEAGPAEMAAWVESIDDAALRTEALHAAAEALRPAPDRQADRLAHFRDPEVRKGIEAILSQPPP